jgi:hypothetical protein
VDESRKPNPRNDSDNRGESARKVNQMSEEKPASESPSSSSRCSVLGVYDNRYVDSTWLASFCERVNSLHFRVDRVSFVCDAGQWIAYSGEQWHTLVEVNYRFEVANLLRALKIDA